MNYRIGDFVIRIKNASLARRRSVVVPYSKAVLAVGNVLVKKGLLEKIKEKKVEEKRVLEALVKFDRRVPKVNHVEIVSRPSLRVYVSAKDMYSLEKGIVTSVISTSKGIMIGKDAYKKGIGGEVLFKIW